MANKISKYALHHVDDGRIDWTPIENNFTDIENTINEHADEIKTLAQRQTIVYKYPILEKGTYTMVRGGKHLRIKIIKGWVTVSDNSGREQTIQLPGISEPLSISSTYGAGVIVPLIIGLNNDKVMFHKDITINASGNRYVTVELLCESYELEGE